MEMELFGSSSFFKLEGSKGHPPGSSLSLELSGMLSASSVRQCYSSSLPQQTRGYEEQCLADFGSLYFQVGGATLGLHIGSPPKRIPQSADFLSRSQLRQDKWALKLQAFQLFVAKWGLPEADLFSSYKNEKVDRFFSMNPRGAWAVDAL